MRRTVLVAGALICTATFGPVPTTAWAQAPSLSREDLIQRTIERRAVEAVIWGMPAVNYQLMLQEMVNKAKGDVNQIVYWSRLPTWKNQTLTPNPDSVYLMAFFNTKGVGPMVLEIPPANGGSLTANIDNIWQVALEDAGPSGADKGKGGKYLILPPGYKEKLPAGYIHLQSDTYGGYALLRSTPASGSDADVAKAVAYGKRIKLYPLSQVANPLPTKFVDAIDVVFDSTIPYDLRFFQSLDRIVRNEPWLERDRAMIDQLKSIGIEKGKPFNPDAKMKAILEAAAREARAWLELKYETAFAPYNDGHHWGVPAKPEVIEGQSDSYAKRDIYPTDDRGLTYTYGFIGIKRLGAGQFYLMTIKDKDGRSLDGGSTYRLTVPANAPVDQYWSATAYNRATHAFIRDLPRFSRSSQNPELEKNADGSVDVYFGPKAPVGKEVNWVPTRADGGFEVLFRLYGPQKPLFDKTWKLPDIEKISGKPELARAQPAANNAVPVTADNFNRAESDMYFASGVKQAGGVGKFYHHREVMPIDNQTVIRANRDTLYSTGVFDLDASPVTITLPDPGNRFMSMLVIDQDQYAPETVYAPGTFTYTKDKVGTRYVMLGIRTFIDPGDPKDLERTHALQDAIKVDQKNAGTFDIPNWDKESQKKVRDALIVLAGTFPDTVRMFGPRDQVDPIRHLIGSATGWGGNAPKDATYLTVVPRQNDGAVIHRLTVTDVPVDGFWSISVYNKDGYFEKNPYDAYSLNNITAKKDADGSVAIRFGGCDGKIANCLPITPGWNYWVRLYRPRAEILSGQWSFPRAEPVQAGASRALQ